MIELITKEELLLTLQSFLRRSAIMYGAYMTEEDEKMAFDKGGFKRSLSGVVNVCRPGEGWPQHEGVNLHPLLQICFADLPFVPEELKDVTYITLFSHPNKLDLSQVDECCNLRVYYDEDLIFLQEPDGLEEDLLISNRGSYIEFSITEDYPHHNDLPKDLDRFMEEHYLSAQCHSEGIGKLFGWPSWEGNGRMLNDWMLNDCVFVFQQELTRSRYCFEGSFYVFRSLKTKKWHVIFECFD